MVLIATSSLLGRLRGLINAVIIGLYVKYPEPPSMRSGLGRARAFQGSNGFRVYNMFQGDGCCSAGFFHVFSMRKRNTCSLLGV